jgi:hypothetical protein
MPDTEIAPPESQTESVSNKSAFLSTDQSRALQRYRFAAALVPFVLLAGSLTMTSEAVSVPIDSAVTTSTTQLNAHYLAMIGRHISLQEARESALASLLKAEREREAAAIAEARFWESTGLEDV